MARKLKCFLQERCILDGTLTVNYEQVDIEYRLRHNDLLANIVHRLVKLDSDIHNSSMTMMQKYSIAICGLLYSNVQFT